MSQSADCGTRSESERGKDGAMTLTEFLLAQIAHDEETAHNWSRFEVRDGIPGSYRIKERVLAECEAKRRIVERERWRPALANHGCDGHPQSYAPHGDYGPGYCHWGQDHDGEDSPTLRELAAIYADHPDYRDEWRPI